MRKSIEDHLTQWFQERPHLRDTEQCIWKKIEDLVLKHNCPTQEIVTCLKKLRVRATESDIADLLNSPLMRPPQVHYFPIWEAIGFCKLSSSPVPVKLAAVPTLSPRTPNALIFSFGNAPGHLLVGEFQGRPVVRLIIQTDPEVDEQLERKNAGRVLEGYTPVRRLETEKQWKMVSPVTK
jgi:hypothetical protein